MGEGPDLHHRPKWRRDFSAVQRRRDAGVSGKPRAYPERLGWPETSLVHRNHLLDPRVHARASPIPQTLPVAPRVRALVCGNGRTRHLPTGLETDEAGRDVPRDHQESVDSSTGVYVLFSVILGSSVIAFVLYRFWQHVRRPDLDHTEFGGADRSVLERTIDHLRWNKRLQRHHDLGWLQSRRVRKEGLSLDGRLARRPGYASVRAFSRLHFLILLF